jgi:hypothetical protein
MRRAFLSGLFFGALVGVGGTLFAILSLSSQTTLGAELIYVINHASRPVDFSRLRKGDWHALCLVGPYERPGRVLGEFAASEKINLVPGAEKGDVPPVVLGQTDTYAAVVDRSGHVEWASLGGRVTVADEHSSKCTLRDSPMIEIPVCGSKRIRCSVK